MTETRTISNHIALLYGRSHYLYIQSTIFLMNSIKIEQFFVHKYTTNTSNLSNVNKQIEIK